VCASCILPPTRIVSALCEALGLGTDGEETMVWRCGQLRHELLLQGVTTSANNCVQAAPFCASPFIVALRCPARVTQTVKRL